MSVWSGWQDLNLRVLNIPNVAGYQTPQHPDNKLFLTITIEETIKENGLLGGICTCVQIQITSFTTSGDLMENRTPILRMKILCPKPLDDEAK